jgi:hypothetical protein
MGKIGEGTKVWDEKGLDHPTFSTNCSSMLSVRNPILTQHPGTVQSRAPRSNRSALRR